MLKKLITFFKKETNFVLLLILIITIFGLGSLFYNQFLVIPPGSVYTFAHNYVPDYYQYLSWMKDGADGKILITSRYSPDTFSRKPAYLFYPLIGWLSGKIGLTMFFGYTLARIFFSLLKLFVIYYLISQIFRQSSERKLAFFFALFLPPFYKLFPFKVLRQDIASLDILQRTFFLPHNLAATVSIIIGAICLNIYLCNSTKAFANSKLLILTSLLFFFASITNPAMLAIFYLFLLPAWLITFIQNPSLPLIINSTAIFLPGLLSIIYYQYLFQNFLPFSWLFYQQKNVSLMMDLKNYFLNCGPVIFFFPFGLKLFLKKRKFLENFIVTWGILPFAILPLLGKIFPFSQERFFEISHFIPLAILATAGFYQLLKFIKQGKERILCQKIILAILVVFTLPFLWHSMKFEVEFFGKPYFNLFVSKSLIETFTWMDKNTPDEAVVATPYFTGNMLPAFTHNKVVFGHDFVTYKATERKADMEVIFDKNTPPSQVSQLLKKYQVNYLLVSPEIPLNQTNLAKISSLRLVFSNEENLVFKTEF